MASSTGSGPFADGVAGATVSTAQRRSPNSGASPPRSCLPNGDLDIAVTTAMFYAIGSSGQICGAASRTLVRRESEGEFLDLLTTRVEALRGGDPRAEDTFLVPVVSADQWSTVQDYIHQGIDAGARLVVGGMRKPDLPDEFRDGHFAKPTVVVANDLIIARDEIFGPAMPVVAYDMIEEAVRIANDSPFGLCGCVTSADPVRVCEAAEQMRTGSALINDADSEFNTGWGGYRQSGNGREWADFGIGEHLEIKSIVGMTAA